MNHPGLSPLTPEGWFEKGHGITGGVPDQNNVWITTHEATGDMHLRAPLPAVADAALKEPLETCHRRTDTFHVMLIPRLRTPRWSHLFNKAYEFSFVVSPGSSFWPVKIYKPLWVGIVLLFTKHRPWCLRQTPLLVEMRRSLCGLLETCEADARDLLRELENFCSSQGACTPYPSVWHAKCYTCLGQKYPRFPMATIKDKQGNVWHKEEERQQRLMQGVKGAHLSTPFQCKTYWYQNLKGRELWAGESNFMLACIRRANLDAMAGKSPLTIRGHLVETITVLRKAERINKAPSYHPCGPFPLGNPVGMGLAIDILTKSLVAKGWLVDYVQFFTIQKLCATYTKNWKSSSAGVLEGASFAKGVGRVRPTSCPSLSEWFYRFQRGMAYRMGSQSAKLRFADGSHCILVVIVDDGRA